MLVLGVVVSAETINVGGSVNATTRGNSMEARLEAQIGSTTEDDEDGDDVYMEVKGMAGEKMGGDNATSTMRRSAMATMVLRLNAVANRDFGIGAEVRAIAAEQASSSERAIEAQEKAEARNALVTLLFGADYKNLGRLRSEIATTDNSIRRLTAAMNRSTDATVRTELQSQIDVLETQKEETAEFVTTNESKFSIFGWFVKLFVSSDSSATATTTPVQ